MLTLGPWRPWEFFHSDVFDNFGGEICVQSSLDFLGLVIFFEVVLMCLRKFEHLGIINDEFRRKQIETYQSSKDRRFG